MATPAAQTRLTPEEYIAFKRKALPDADIIRHESINGELIAMSGASRAHNLITINVSAALHSRLRDSECETYANDMRVSTPTTTSYFYPDVVVVCEEPRFEDEVFDILLNPIILVEVLSPSTEVYDRREKIRALPTTPIIAGIRSRRPRSGSCRTLPPPRKTGHRTPYAEELDLHRFPRT